MFLCDEAQWTWNVHWQLSVLKQLYEKLILPNEKLISSSSSSHSSSSSSPYSPLSRSFSSSSSWHYTDIRVPASAIGDIFLDYFNSSGRTSPPQILYQTFIFRAGFDPLYQCSRGEIYEYLSLQIFTYNIDWVTFCRKTQCTVFYEASGWNQSN